MQSQCVLISFPVICRGSLPQDGNPDYIPGSVRTLGADQSESTEDDGQGFLLDKRGTRKDAANQEFGKVSIFQPKNGISNDGKLDYELTQYLGEENGSPTYGSPD